MEENKGQIIITPNIREILLANPHYFIYLYKHGTDYWSIGGVHESKEAGWGVGSLRHHIIAGFYRWDKEIEILPYQKTDLCLSLRSGETIEIDILPHLMALEKPRPTTTIEETMIRSFLGNGHINKFLNYYQNNLYLYWITSSENSTLDKPKLNLSNITDQLVFDKLNPALEQEVDDALKRISEQLEKNKNASDFLRKRYPIDQVLEEYNGGPLHDCLVHPK